VIPRILSIAGSDSGGGAGIQADIKTITMMHGHAMTAITAITAQNSRSVAVVDVVAPDMLRAQIEAVLNDFGADAIKIGMLGSADNAHAVADILEQFSHIPVVFDPVMLATTGARLADDSTIHAFDRLMALSALVTPNLPELAALGGEEQVLKRCPALLVKGGHDDQNDVQDRLLFGEGAQNIWTDQRIFTNSNHGTGCTLSSAIATILGRGNDVTDAVRQARTFVRLALRDAPELVVKNGPMGHYAIRNDAIMPGPLFNQVTVDCSDYDGSLIFYRQLGLTLIVDSSPQYARFEAANGATLSLHKADKGVSSASLYFEFTNLDAMVEGLLAKGWHFDGSLQDQSWNWREIWTKDPSGHRICLYHAGEDRRHPPWRIKSD